MRVLLLLLICVLTADAQSVLLGRQRQERQPVASAASVWVTNGGTYSTVAALGRYTTNQFVAFKWTNTTYTALNKIGVNVTKAGTPTQTVSVFLYSDAGTDPNAQLVAGGTFDATSAPAVMEVSLSASLSASTAYWVVFDAGSVSAANYLQLDVGALATPYARASADGSSWNATSAGNRSGRFWVYVQ